MQRDFVCFLERRQKIGGLNFRAPDKCSIFHMTDKEAVNELILHTQAVRISGFLQVMLCMYNSFVSLRKECLSGVVNMAAVCSVSKSKNSYESY